MERHWPVGQALRQFVQQVVWQLFRGFILAQVHDPLGRNDVAEWLSLAGSVYEHERVYAVILLIGVTVGRTERGICFFDARVTLEKGLELG